MVQYAFWKAVGLFCTNSWQVAAVDAQVESVSQTAPAQSPHSAVLMTIRWSEKCWSISQGAANLAEGRPQVAGDGVSLVISDGILPRGKNQMLIASLVHSVA